MHWIARRKTTAGFSIALVLLLLVDTVALISVRLLTNTVHWQIHAYKVLDDLDQLLLLLQDAETGQRGFLLTGEDSYLNPYRTSIAAIREDFNELRLLTADNAAHKQRLAMLEPLVERKIAELSTTIDLRKNDGFAAALTVVLTGEGKYTMDKIRAGIAELKQAEKELLRERERSAGVRARTASLIIIVGNVLGLLLLAAAHFIILRGEKQRRNAEHELRKAYDLLELRVAERTGALSEANEQLQTEIKRRILAERQLEVVLQNIKNSHEDLLSVLNQLDVVAVITDLRGCVTFFSHSARKFFGLQPDAAPGRQWEDVIPLGEAEKAIIHAAIKCPASERSKTSVLIRLPQDRHYWMEIEVKDDLRDPLQKILLFHDVTEVYDLRHQLDVKKQFLDMVGKSAVMQAVFQQIQLLAVTDATVLIEGDTGTGKEMVARAIHNQSHRHGKPFMAVNLAGVTVSLLNSLLFGHKRGAFTGAVTDHIGFFEAADEGTIFLDEIGEMPMEVQTALLRVIQEREIVRLGESKPRKINVRLLAATQHDLNKSIEAGLFRPDLLYRIRVGRIVLPALRERREDIPLLVNHFLSLCCTETGNAAKKEISHEAMRVILDYPWPGNVRELKSVIEYAFIQAPRSLILLKDLPPEILQSIFISSAVPLIKPGADEKQRILEAIDRTRGNRTLAAALLGISRATLYRRLAQLEQDSEKISPGSKSEQCRLFK